MNVAYKRKAVEGMTVTSSGFAVFPEQVFEMNSLYI